MRNVFLASLLLLGAWLAQATQVFAQDVQPVPPLVGRVIDSTGALQGDDLARVQARLQALEDKLGAQMVVLIVPTTQPEDIASYANRVANAWKIGRKREGDGLLLVIARRDGRLRLEVSKALEGAIPDLAAKRIIDEQLAPALNQRQYAQGLIAAIDAIEQRIAQENLSRPSQGAGMPTSTGYPMLDQVMQRSGFSWEDMAIFLFVVVPLGGAVARGIFGNKLGSLVTGGVLGGLAYWLTLSLIAAGIAFMLAFLLTLFMGSSKRIAYRRSRHSPVWVDGYDAGGWGGGGFDGGFGGGFGSGGGGDFGGGGASGSFAGD